MNRILLFIFLFISTLGQAQLRSSGTGTGNIVYSTSPTITTPSFTTGFKIGGAAASGKIPIGDGTNYIASTPTYPNTSPTSRKILVSDGTNIVASTETWAVPG